MMQLGTAQLQEDALITRVICNSRQLIDPCHKGARSMLPMIATILRNYHHIRYRLPQRPLLLSAIKIRAPRIHQGQVGR